ncbi:MAG TPA: hypothetical protein VL995_11455 [Cellvibrio sp.]|nr:hypothetical protein [Cellvibrio sp.]
MGLNYGEVDEITEIRVGDRVAWQGNISSNTTITIDKPDLFGGDESEGGIQGTLDVMLGAPNQPVNSKLAAMFGRAVSAYRKRTTLFFDGMVCALSKYPKPWSIRRNRRLKGWDGGVWYPAKAAIDLPGGIKAMNGAHIIYEALTNRDWGDKKPRSKLDEASFREAADICYAEGLGLCMEYFRQSPIKEFIGEVQSHIGANVFQSRTTGLWTIRLVRAPTDINALPLFTPATGLLGIEDDDNAAPVVAVNDIVVIFTDVLRQKEGSVRIPNSAGHRSAGGAISETVTYSGIPTAELAARLGQRDLRAKYSAKKFKVKLDRRGYKIEPGGLFRISDPARGIANLVLRAGKIDDGTIDSGVIRVDAALDVFGLPSNSFVKPQPPLYTPPSTTPLPVATRFVSEATYRDLAMALDNAALESITPGTNFLTTMALAPSGLSLNYQLETRVSPGKWRSDTCEFCPTAIVVPEIPLGAAPVTVALQNIIGLDVVAIGSACAIDNEILRVDAVNLSALTVTLARGCIDTVPAAHAAGARIWFYEDYLGVASNEFAAGVNVQTRMLTRTVSGVLDAGSAPLDTYLMAQRRERPYPPGNVRINGDAYPAKVVGGLTVAFSYRNRVVQADQLIDTTMVGINDESGTTYRMKIIGDGVQLDDVVLPPDDNVHVLTIDDEKLAGLTHLPHNFTLRATGLQAVTSTLSSNLFLFEDADFFAQQYAKVVGGWLAFYNVGTLVRAAYVDDTSGAKTIATCDLKTQTRSQLVTFVSGVPKIDYVIAENTNSSFTGWATYWAEVNSPDNGYVAERLGIYNQPPFKDRRSNPDHIVTANYGAASLAFSSQRYFNMRRINFIEYSLHVVKKSAVTPGGAMATQRTVMDSYWLSTADQFDSATGTAPEVPPYMNLDSIMKAYNAHDLIYETGVIFGSVLYVHYHRGTGAATTTGKALDITNVFSSGHINYKTGTELVTKTYSITAAGVLTPIAIRAGFYIADQLNATQGIEILYSTRQVWLVNVTTGAQGTLLGTLDFDPCAVYGDTTNEHIYILGVDGTLRKYNATLTLLASIFVGATDRALPWILRRSNIKESHGFFYVQYAAKTYSVNKDLSAARAIEGFLQTFPGYANPSSPIVLMYAGIGAAGTGLADESGIATAVFNQPKPRVAGNLTVEVSSQREGLVSAQKHVITTKRVGYGLRYGFNYR